VKNLTTPCMQIGKSLAFPFEKTSGKRKKLEQMGEKGLRKE